MGHILLCYRYHCQLQGIIVDMDVTPMRDVTPNPHGGMAWAADVEPDAGEIEVLSDEVIDLAIWSLRKTGTSLRDCQAKLAAGIEIPGIPEVVAFEMSHVQIGRRFKAMVQVEKPDGDVEYWRALELVTLGENQAFAIRVRDGLEPGKYSMKDRLAAGRLVDSTVKTRAALLGLNAPVKVDVNQKTEVEISVLREKAERVLAERLEGHAARDGVPGISGYDSAVVMEGAEVA